MISTSARRAPSRLPPSRSIASSFVRGACRSDDRRHAELPCGPGDPLAMFPALTVTTPFAVSAAGALRIALTAPRILNEPIGCRFSSLSQSSAGASTSSRTSARIAAGNVFRALDRGEIDQELDLRAGALLLRFRTTSWPPRGPRRRARAT